MVAIKDKLIIFLILFFPVSAFSQTFHRKILLAVETKSFVETRINKYTNEKTRLTLLSWTPRLAFGIGKNLMIGGRYEFGNYNIKDFPMIRGYGVFSRYYLSFLDERWNRGWEKSSFRVFPYAELEFAKSNEYFEDGGLRLDEESNKYLRTLLTGAVDLRPFRFNLNISAGVRFIYFWEGPERKLLPLDKKIEISYIF